MRQVRRINNYSKSVAFLISRVSAAVQAQVDFINIEEQRLIDSIQRDKSSDLDERESNGNHEITDVILRALSLEVDRSKIYSFFHFFWRIVSHNRSFHVHSWPFHTHINRRAKFLQRSYHRSRVAKIQKYHQAILNDETEKDKLSSPVGVSMILVFNL
jgi:hypothetical protein